MDHRRSAVLIRERLGSPQIKRAAGWTAALGGLVAFFLLVTFPYDALQARILAEVSGRTGVDITADQWEMNWPLGLTWRGVSLVADENVRMQMDELRVTFNAASVLTGRLAANLDASLHSDASVGGGRATVRVTADAWSGTGPLSISGRIERLPFSALGFPAVRRGHLSVDFTQRWEGTSPGGAAVLEGTWTIDVADVSIEQFVSGQLRFPAITLAHAKMTVQCRTTVCRIQELTGDGADGFVHGDGQVMLRRPFRNSTLALSISVRPSPAFVQRATASGLPLAAAGVPMRVSVGGSIAHPQLTVL
ncbi:MAG TPA: type II secretion system protein GspN [Nitrospiraceae bacterium]|jgi:type II secretion system protein N|nr:type II secretion system protein GspN [Nitrospiraceae bacterium]